jgi:hypothetical protein
MTGLNELNVVGEIMEMSSQLESSSATQGQKEGNLVGRYPSKTHLIRLETKLLSRANNSAKLLYLSKA